MVILFLGLCEKAGIIEEAPTHASRPKPSRQTTGTPTARSRAKGTGRAGASSPSGALPNAIEGLLKELAQIGPTWTQERRDQFLMVWEAVVDFCFPVHEPGSSSGSDPE